LLGRIIEFFMYLGDSRKGHDEEKVIIVYRDSRTYIISEAAHFEEKTCQNIDVNGFFERDRDTPCFDGSA